jgi:6-phosphogluconolactonase (cycloisomerase 2 family)
MVDPLGQYVYVTNRGDTTISQFSISPGGALVAAGQVQAGLHPTSIAAGY